MLEKELDIQALSTDIIENCKKNSFILVETSKEKTSQDVLDCFGKDRTEFTKKVFDWEI